MGEAGDARAPGKGRSTTEAPFVPWGGLPDHKRFDESHHTLNSITAAPAPQVAP